MRILFVCTGNTCRSPMAEGIFKSIVSKGEVLFECSSAGLATQPNLHAAQNAIDVCNEIGIDISNHRSRVIVNPSDLSEVDLIIVMTQSHADMLNMIGIPENKIKVLGCGILDPFGGNIETYRKCRDEIKHSLNELYQELKLKF